MRLSVIGLGKLGLPLYLVLRQAGYDVLGVDTDAAKLQTLAEGRSPIDEPYVQDMLLQEKCATSDSIRAAVIERDMSFTVVNTPLDTTGRLSLHQVLPAMRQVAEAMRDNPQHIPVLVSTTNPGDCRQQIRPMMEEVAGGAVPLLYNPTFIALGSVVWDLKHPRILLVGRRTMRDAWADAWAVEKLRALWGLVWEKELKAGVNFIEHEGQQILSHPLLPYQETSYEMAELSKLAVNVYLCMKISFSNMLASLCNALPHGDIREVLRVMDQDPRINTQYMQPGLGFGGPCFPRDMAMFSEFVVEQHVEDTLVNGIIGINENLPFSIEKILLESLGSLEERRVAVLGMAYKPGTPIVEKSPGLAIAYRLSRGGASVLVHDPHPQAVREALGDLQHVGAVICLSLQVAMGTDAIIIACPHRQYKDFDFSAYRGLLFDGWHIVQVQKRPANYIAWGVHP